ncbi:16S rRNA (guanine(966)-N(2))-methyltransferase RsmD [Myceligenerans halotolerans]
MRIVAGRLGGRTLVVPPKGTRPTSDRVREAIFSRLDHLDVLDGTRVLDLYAGSGALGLEAASRGARHVTLVDSARGAVAAARKNVAALGLAPHVQVVNGPVERYTAALAAAPPSSGAALDLVFLDPPYDLSDDDLARVLRDLAAPGVLARAAVVVVERSARSPEPSWPEGLALIGRKPYGETAVYYTEPIGPAAPEEPAAD